GKLTRSQMWARVLRPRVLIYGAGLFALSAAFVASLALRSRLKVDVVRGRGSLARLVEGGRIENVYRLQLMNATEEAQRYRLDVSGLDGAQIVSNAEVQIGPAQARWFTVQVRVPAAAADAAGPGAHPIRFEVA